ncbi:MAG: acetate--CoA ligase family protein [Candidatus Heimdallarchaeota archaeon]|nr:MAG: acetate--CoA ligase family protein [Candidatus Heimdallarchaeota archaeon]
MRLYEHESKRVFEQSGIPIPKQFGVVHSINEIEKLDLKFPVMAKAAVLIGGRGKAGGIKKVNSLKEAINITEELLKLRIKEHPVQTVFFEEAVEEHGACYLGVTTDPNTFNNVLIVSASGGVDIEEVAQTRPEAIIKREIVNNDRSLQNNIIKEITDILAQDLQLSSKQKEILAIIINKVYRTYQDIDAKLCEINPVIITPDNIVAADAKIVLDDNGLYRQSKLLESLGITSKRHDVAEPTPNEEQAYNQGFPYVDLLPPDVTKEKDKLYVGIVPGGAGYGIFSIDEVMNIGNKFFDGKVVPINFMDSGGGPPQNRVAQMFHLLMDYPLTDIIITSRFGGISSCDVFIRGLIQAFRERHRNNQRLIPVYGRMVGTDLPSAKNYLEKAKNETPKALQMMEIVVGNEQIMADVIKEGIKRGFEIKKEASA